MVDLRMARILLIAVLCLSLGFSLLYLSRRNLYDDELASFGFVLSPTAAIWTTVNTHDVHPPGMYILSHLFYELTHSERWLTLGPLLILYAGLTFFALALLPWFADDAMALLVFLALLFFHPTLLMWGNSIRWYPYWTSLALIVLALCIQRPDEARAGPPGRTVCVVIGLILAGMFYLNYLTIVFGAALVAALCAAFPVDKKMAARLATIIATAGLLAIPQLGPMLHIHLHNSQDQRASILVAAARLFHGTFMSEAMLPWSPAALLFAALVGVPLVAREAWEVLRPGAAWRRNPFQAIGAPALVFFAVLMGLGVLLGLGGKPRSFMVLAPVLAVILAQGFSRLRRSSVRLVLAAVCVVWVACGCSNLLKRQGTAKNGLNDHLEDVQAFLREQGAHACNVVFVQDPALSYLLNRDLAPSGSWTIYAAYTDFIHHAVAGTAPESKCRPDQVFVVRSFEGSVGANATLPAAIALAVRQIEKPKRRELLADPDAALKRRMPGGQGLPSYRFTVDYGSLGPEADLRAAAASFGNISGRLAR